MAPRSTPRQGNLFAGGADAQYAPADVWFYGADGSATMAVTAERTAVMVRASPPRP